MKLKCNLKKLFVPITLRCTCANRIVDVLQKIAQSVDLPLYSGFDMVAASKLFVIYIVHFELSNSQFHRCFRLRVIYICGHLVAIELSFGRRQTHFLISN